MRPLGTEIGLSLGDTMLDGTQLAPEKRAQPPHPIFGWMDQDATWYGVKPRPRRRCVRWGSQ